MATRIDGKRYWEDYFSTSYELSDVSSLLIVSGKLESVPVCYERRYTLGDQELNVEVALTAEKDISLHSLHENVPLAFGPAKSGDSSIRVAEENDGSALADRVVVENKAGSGIEIKLSERRSMRIVRKGLRDSRISIERLEILLPNELEAAETVRLQYVLRPSHEVAHPPVKE